MSLTSCTIRFTNKPEKVIYASSALLKLLKLKNKKNVTLRLGQQSVSASIRTLKGKGKHLYLTTALRSILKPPHTGTCYIQSNEDDELRIGPLIGILTSSYHNSMSPFGGRTGLIRQLLRYGKNRAFYCAFGPRDINWQNETVTGYFLGARGGWTRRTVPLPDVVYNRLPSRKAEKTASMQQFKERFVRRRIPLFNWSFYDKWDVYRLLEGDPASKYVPESAYNPTGPRIKEMLEKHQFVYLKPTGGSLGRGIYRLTYLPQKGYYCRYRHNGSNVLLRFSSFTQLLKRLNRRGRMHNYVVQQGIRLVELDRCPIDFRFHMNKNGDNQWVAAGIGAKKSGRGSVTTHIKNGGKLMTPETALGHIYGSSAKAEDILSKAKQASIQLAEAIERNDPHHIGELGFDIGIDQKDQIWMFEANAKPGRSIFKHPSLKSEGAATLKHIFEYSVYLSRFRPGREGS
jgi:hypothetical protein